MIHVYPCELKRYLLALESYFYDPHTSRIFQPPKKDSVYSAVGFDWFNYMKTDTAIISNVLNKVSIYMLLNLKHLRKTIAVLTVEIISEFIKYCGY